MIRLLIFEQLCFSCTIKLGPFPYVSHDFSDMEERVSAHIKVVVLFWSRPSDLLCSILHLGFPPPWIFLVSIDADEKIGMSILVHMIQLYLFSSLSSEFCDIDFAF